MTAFEDEFRNLRRISATIGADPMLIQAAGGNTSIKQGDVMWIKASGTLLADSLDKDVFVAVDLPGMRQAVATHDTRADLPAEFALQKGRLRPSIETSLHAVFSQKVVIHAHCVHTLVHAVQAECTVSLSRCLEGLDWDIVSYAKPGANLARRVAEIANGSVNVVILKNHGVIVAAETVEESHALLKAVHNRLQVDPAPNKAPDLVALENTIRDSDYALPQYAPLHQLALDEARMKQAAMGSLYPDHVIFCGIGVPVLESDETPDELAARFRVRHMSKPVFMIVPGKGVLMKRGATSSNQALSRCLADVLVRMPPDAKLSYLTERQNLELLNWDAEKYRSTLDV